MFGGWDEASGSQENSDLTMATWTDVTNVPVLNLTNLQNQVIVPASSITSRFYRMKHCKRTPTGPRQTGPR